MPRGALVLRFVLTHGLNGLLAPLAGRGAARDASCAGVCGCRSREISERNLNQQRRGNRIVMDARVKTKTRRCRCVLLMALIVMGAADTQADDPAQSESPTEGATTSNQAVSIEVSKDGESAPLDRASPPSESSGERRADKASPESERKRSLNSARDVSSSSRAGPRALRRSSSSVSSRRSTDRETPWYSSGVGALAIVLVVVAGGYWLVRRYLPSVRTTGSNALRVVARTSVTPKHHLALVQLGRRFVLVGVSGDRLQTLSEVTETQEVAEVAAQTGATLAGRPNGFDDLLAKESDDYHEDPDADDVEDLALSSQTPAQGVGSARAGKPVADLLDRLRALQSK